jgi:hypothetical protein
VLQPRNVAACSRANAYFCLPILMVSKGLCVEGWDRKKKNGKHKKCLFENGSTSVVGLPLARKVSVEELWDEETAWGGWENV